MDVAIAVAALAVALGATDDEVDGVWEHLQTLPVPYTPARAITQVRAALAIVRAGS